MFLDSYLILLVTFIWHISAIRCDNWWLSIRLETWQQICLQRTVTELLFQTSLTYTEAFSEQIQTYIFLNTCLRAFLSYSLCDCSIMCGPYCYKFCFPIFLLIFSCSPLAQTDSCVLTNWGGNRWPPLQGTLFRYSWNENIANHHLQAGPSSVWSWKNKTEAEIPPVSVLITISFRSLSTTCLWLKYLKTVDRS